MLPVGGQSVMSIDANNAFADFDDKYGFKKAVFALRRETSPQLSDMVGIFFFRNLRRTEAACSTWLASCRRGSISRAISNALSSSPFLTKVEAVAASEAASVIRSIIATTQRVAPCLAAFLVFVRLAIGPSGVHSPRTPMLPLRPK